MSGTMRLLGVQRLDHDPIAGTRNLHTITDLVTTATETRVPGPRLGQQRTHALLAAFLISTSKAACSFARRPRRGVILVPGKASSARHGSRVRLEHQRDSLDLIAITRTMGPVGWAKMVRIAAATKSSWPLGARAKTLRIK